MRLIFWRHNPKPTTTEEPRPCNQYQQDREQARSRISLAKFFPEREPLFVKSLQLVNIFLHPAHIHTSLRTNTNYGTLPLKILDELKLLIVGLDPMTEGNP